MARRYRAFISYSWADKEWAAWIHRALELYQPPRALIGKETPVGPVPPRLHPIFRDREEEAAGGGIGAAIEAALAGSEFLIVVCSPRSAQSPWVNREIAWFKRHRDPARILALIVDGEPHAGTPGAECFPPALLFKIDETYAATAEREDPPLAADARPEGDGRRGAKLKLAAALIGVGLDELVRRDDKRRSVRRRLVTASALALAFAMSGLALFALDQRDAAILARNEALAAQAAAEAAESDAKFQANEAQSLVEFMLTDFRQELDSLGRLDVLERTGKRLLESFAKQDVEKLGANALGRRARVLLLLGEVDNTRGNLDEALARYKEAAATTEELLRRNPGEAQQIFDHAQSVFWVGYIAWQRGDAALAKKQFTEYYDLAQRLVAIDPAKEEWRTEVGYAVNNLGILAMDQGQAMEAESAFRAYRQVASRRLERHPRDINDLLELGRAYAWLADAQYSQGKISASLASRLSEVALYERGFELAPENLALTEQRIVANYALAWLTVADGNAKSALEYANAALLLAKNAAIVDPTDVERADRAAFAIAVYGEVLIYLGRLQEARDAVFEAVAAAEKLPSYDAGGLEEQALTRAHALLALARLNAVAGNEQYASETYRRVADDLRPLVYSSSPDLGAVRRYCAALAGRARLSTEFDSDWAKIAETLGFEQKSHGPEGQTLLAEAYSRTGKRKEAATIVSRLHAAGYRHPDFMALLEEYPALRPAAIGDDAAAR